MPTFITIGYGDRDGYERTSAAARTAAHARDEDLRHAGVLIGIAGAAVQVRNPEGAGVEVRHGAFMRSALPVAGFAVIHADSLADAIRLVQGTPCAVAHGVVEVWPLTGAEAEPASP